MSTSNETSQKDLARLVGAANYVLRDRHCQPGQTWVFSEAEVIHCEEHAVRIRTVFDPYTGEALGEPLSMFEFEPFSGPEPVGHRFPTAEELAAVEAAKVARARARRIALARMEPTPATASRARTRLRP